MSLEDQTILNRIEQIEKSLFLQKEVLTLEEVSRYSGLSKSYLYKLTSLQRIPHYKPNGKNIYFNRKELESWLMSNRIKTKEEIESQAANYLISKK
jgi:excisionase family DNA binding protein